MAALAASIATDYKCMCVWVCMHVFACIQLAMVEVSYPNWGDAHVGQTGGLEGIITPGTRDILS